MIFALLTLLAALGLAAVAGWFSIIGIMSIYAGAAIHALIMGTVLEAGKLVTISWLYRNWDFANWKLKSPLVVFTLILMLANGIGVFGFLSKAHLEQGASTVDNSAKIERLDQQIAREKSTIDDDNKVIQQLDATINSYLGKDRTDRSLYVRKSQAPQRQQLREDIDAAQKRIDGYSDQKLQLQSEVKKMQLDVGPIRYIAELIYGTNGDADKNIESAVRVFTLIIVSTLDPLAVILLIAANHTLLRRQREKEQEEASIQADKIRTGNNSIAADQVEREENKEQLTLPKEIIASDVPEIVPAGISTEEVQPVCEEVLQEPRKSINEESQSEEVTHIESTESNEVSGLHLLAEHSDKHHESEEDRLHESQETAAPTRSPFPRTAIPESRYEVNEEEEAVYDIDIARAEEEGLLPHSWGTEIYNVEDSEMESRSTGTANYTQHSELPNQVSLSEEAENIFVSLALSDIQSPPIGVSSPNLSKIRTQPESTTTPEEEEKVKEQKRATLVAAGLLDYRPHFIPLRVNEENKSKELGETKALGEEASPSRSVGEESNIGETEIEETQTVQQETSPAPQEDTAVQGEVESKVFSGVSNFPRTLSWLNEFKRT